jgi:hypothetical protein
MVWDGASDLPGGCEHEWPYETVLTKLGAGDEVVSRFVATGLLWHQSRIGFVVDRDDTRLAIAYETVQFHGGQDIVDGIVVGADLGERFDANHAGGPTGL